MTDPPLVHVIVVNYNGLKYLRACLSSIERQTYQNFETIVIDNASTDNSEEYIRQYFPKITLIQASRNLGFAEGNNLAIKSTLDQKADYIFLVNNDTELESDLVEKLIRTAERDDSIGIVGPAVFDLKNKESLQEMGMAIDKFGYALALKSSLNKDCVFFVSGCAMMIKSELILKIGIFDESYFMFAEDLDLCWRSWLAGYKIIVNENARIYHASGGSISGGIIKSSIYKTTAKRVFLREKNTLRTLIKNYDFSNLIKFVPFYVALLFFEIIFWSCILKPDISTNIFKAIFWNLKMLPNTFKQRAVVQNLRKIKDDELVMKMLDGYCKLRVFRTVGVPSFVGN
jgi:GT2 family glycosyltransferase